ncbi:unnamed protein product [Rotaria sordida]|uniref:G-protein coupled receptors family 1 profile domain-containing protein n=1 Tax=Rotaria sordida TaxID=392033 RepID=A0A815CMT0_9BILA|nr:unnamed protein product [Rotaria sordida]CAF1295105.1 unnamed protein product [Rotaria sordida]CAF1563312.1 unnamed protein product [Rotaria sordida]CAF3659678.1 unnamed protein product [Rotaria sordida]
MSTATTTAIINTVTRWLNYVVALPMIVFGIIGAILTVFVFTRQPKFRQNPTIIYLLAGAVITAVHLPCNYLQSTLVDGFGLGLFNVNIANCRQQNYFRYMQVVSAISFPCWAAFDQYVSTCRDANVRNRWRSMRLVRCAIIGTVLFWTIVYLPLIFNSIIINGSCTLIDNPYRKFLNFVLTPFVYTIGPITLIIVLTRGTIRNLRCTNLGQHRDHLTKQIRRMLVPQLIVLAISGIPFGLQNIYTDLTSSIQKDSLRKAIELFFLQIVRLFYHCNFVCTFYIYCYTSNEVRHVLKRYVRRRLRRGQVEPTDVSINNSFTLQTMKSTYHT